MNKMISIAASLAFLFLAQQSHAGLQCVLAYNSQTPSENQFILLEKVKTDVDDQFDVLTVAAKIPNELVVVVKKTLNSNDMEVNLKANKQILTITGSLNSKGIFQTALVKDLENAGGTGYGALLYCENKAE